MKRDSLELVTTAALLAAAVLLTVGAKAMAYEEPMFELIAKYGDIEIRRYQPFVIAEVQIDDDFEDAGSGAFKTLFDYISGANRGAAKMEMTVPVIQKPLVGQTIEMTSPVLQRSGTDGDAHLVSFVLPLRFNLATAPRPTDSSVNLRGVPSRLMAVIRYSGFWSAQNFRKHEARLLTGLKSQGYEPMGMPEWARYNDPFTPWFWRRNEILVEVRSAG